MFQEVIPFGDEPEQADDKVLEGASMNTQVNKGLFNRALRITPTVQRYPWGKLGGDSIVCRLSNSAPNGPYAELWIGAHPKAPALVDGVPLNQLLAERGSELLGELHKSFGELPFLFKILSVGTALSIQAHPNIELARELHSHDPKNYPDSNHKPEMGVAISKVELLYGFRPIPEIRELLKARSELSSLLSADAMKGLESQTPNLNEVIKQVYSELVIADLKEREAKIEALYNRLKQQGSNDPHDKILLSLAEKVGFADIGLPSLYLLNYCELHPGQGFYIGPNLPHAYISGDLVECMANSDNVVRAGLTNKFQDLDTLLGMLDFNPAPFNPCQKESVSGTPFSRFLSPAREFQIQVATKASNDKVRTGGRAELLFCLSGAGEVMTDSHKELLNPGTCLLIPAPVDCYQISFSAGDLYRIVAP